MKNFPKLLAVMLLFVLAFSACKKEPIEEGPDCAALNVTYAQDIQPLIANSCAVAGCHVPGGSGRGDFSDFAGLKEKADNGSLKFRVLTQQTMPPGAPLDQADRDKIDCWLQAGALE